MCWHHVAAEEEQMEKRHYVMGDETIEEECATGTVAYMSPEMLDGSKISLLFIVKTYYLGGGYWPTYYQYRKSTKSLQTRTLK